MRLTQLKKHWQSTLLRVQQRSKCLQRQTEQWEFYRTGLKKLKRFLKDLEPLMSPAGLAACSLQQHQQSIQDCKLTQEQLSIHQELYNQTVQACREIFPLADEQTQAELIADLGALQEFWEQSCVLIETRKTLTENVIQNWTCCETGLAEHALRLKEIAVKQKQPPPDTPELQETVFKEDQDSLEQWEGGLRELITMKTNVSQYVLPTDTMLLQGQVEQLHSQWEELCSKVSRRKQEIADRLNAWIIFNDKHKELCDWLAQMEKRVTHNNEYLSIEEMVEKLKKDCMEEINLFSENKSHLKQLGEQLLLASDRAKEAKIHNALQDVNDRWQHLFEHIETRVKKLKETQTAVQQLDKNMSNLRIWLSRIEAELTKPIHYGICNGDEIQNRLKEQQELQKDIEQHTEGVTSVLTLCEMLLHDEDTCSSDRENDSIQLTTHSLDRRWRNICSLSLERKIRIDETWRLWCKFQDDYERFEDWLNQTEHTAAQPDPSDLSYTYAKDELKRFEAFQRDVHDKLTQLENINNQYRRLARENLTDSAKERRTKVHHGNERWDHLNKRVAAILSQLKHFVAQREEFESTRENLMFWLTKMELQLTNVEHLSEGDVHHKLNKLQGLKKEITQNTNKIDALIVFGDDLIQKSIPSDAALIEDELQDLHSYCQKVFSRVGCFHQRLTSSQSENPEISMSEDSAVMETSDVTELSQEKLSSQATTSLLVPPQEFSGRETPLSVESIPLEWDHTGDVGGSSSHDEDDDASFFSSATVPGRDVLAGQNWHSQAAAEGVTFNLQPTPADASTPYKQDYVELMSECSSSIRSVKKVSLFLDDDEQVEDQGLTGLAASDHQTGVIERWELLQARTVNEEHCHSSDPKQLTSDLQNITRWLAKVTPELERLRKAETSSVRIKIVEDRVKQLKEMQKAFACYKTLMLSLNLGGRELQQEASPDVQQLQEGLASMNQSWTDACTSLEGWEDSLRKSLMHCQEFHETLHSLLLWLAHAESRRFIVNIHDPSVQPSVLQEHRTALQGLKDELKTRQRKVLSLQEIASQLLPESSSEDGSDATEKLHVIHNKLCLLLRQVKQDLQNVQERLESSEAAAVGGQDPGALSTEPSAEAASDSTLTGAARVENRDAPPRRSFFYRVLRAAFPLHILFLLLLILTCLVPLSEEDYSCTLSNTFARSFHPMLRYTNGPPPT